MACSTAVRLRSEARPRLVLILARSLCWNGSSSRIDRLLPWPRLVVVHCARCGHLSQALAGNWASLPGTIGTVWPPGQVMVPCAKSRVKSSLVKSVSPGGQGRAIEFIPIEACRASDAKRHRGRQRFCRHPRCARPCLHVQLNRDKLHGTARGAIAMGAEEV